MNLPAIIEADELARRTGAVEAVQLVRSALLSMDELRLANPEDPDGLTRLLQIVRIFERDLVSLRRSTMGDLFAAMPDKKRDVDGVGRIERKQGRSRVIDDITAVDAAIVTRCAYDEHGELVADKTLIARTVQLTKDIYSAKTPKITKAVEILGLDKDDISEWKDGTPTVVLPPVPTR